MKQTFIAVLLLTLATGANAQDKPAAEVKPEAPASKSAPVPEKLRDTVTLHQQATFIRELQLANLQLQFQLQATSLKLDERAAELKAERDRLETQLKKAVDAPDDATVDWSKTPALVVWPAKKP